MIGWVISTLIAIVLISTLLPSDLRRNATPGERRVLSVFIVARLFMPLVMDYVGRNAASLFTGGWDADRYHQNAISVWRDLRATGRSMSHSKIPGTGSIELATGFLYRFFGGPNRLAVVYLATAIASIGILMFWLATRDLVNFRRDRYAALVLMAPTTLFWSSALGKEAPILFGIGALTLGLRYLLSGRRYARAFLYGALGVVLTIYVRPHVTLAFFVAISIASLFSRSSRTVGGRGPARFALIALAVIGLGVSVVQSGNLLDAGGDKSIVKAAYDRAESTAQGQGRAGYAQEPVRSPVQVPSAVITVVLRPFPWEVRSLPQALATVEALIVVGVLIQSITDHFARRRRFEFNALVLSAIIFSLILSSAIASYGNFGLIVRQRMQIWPFLTFLACAPRVTVRKTQDPTVEGLTREMAH